MGNPRVSFESRNGASGGLETLSGTDAHEKLERLPIIRMTNVSLLPGTWDYTI